MNAGVWGHAGQEGGIGPRAAVSTGGYLVLVSSVWGDLMRSTAVGLSLDADAARAEPVWARELPLEADYEREIAAQVTASEPSVVCAGDGRVYLVSGGVRALTPRWRRRAPGGTGIGGGAPADGLCPLSRRTSPEGNREALLWDLRDDAVYEVPHAELISSAPVSFGSLAVLSCGGGAGERLIGLSLETGAVAWEAETLPPNPNYFRAPAPAARPVDPAAVAERAELRLVREVSGAQEPEDVERARDAYGRAHFRRDHGRGVPRSPAAEGRRDLVARPAEARTLLEVPLLKTVPCWATALLQGLLRGTWGPARADLGESGGEPGLGRRPRSALARRDVVGLAGAGRNLGVLGQAPVVSVPLVERLTAGRSSGGAATGRVIELRSPAVEQHRVVDDVVGVRPEPQRDPVAHVPVDDVVGDEVVGALLLRI